MIRNFRFLNEDGINLYLARKVVEILRPLKSEVKILANRGIVDAKDILDLTSLGIGYHDNFVVMTTGEEQDLAMERLTEILSIDQLYVDGLPALNLESFSSEPAQKNVVIYGTTTGNTKTLALVVWEELSKYSLNTVLRNVKDIAPEELSEFDNIVLGCSTWEGGRLQKDFEPFYDQLSKAYLKGKLALVFGPGDESSAKYCTAVDTLGGALQDCGAEMTDPLLKVSGPIHCRNVKKTRHWIRQTSLLRGLKSAG